MKKKHFVSFVEEFVLNPDYSEYIGGRIEVHSPDSDTGYADEEIRFLTTKQKEFYKFREDWDFKEVNKKEVDRLRKTVKEKYMEDVNEL